MNAAVTVTATTHTSTPRRFSVQLGTGIVSIQSLKRFGDAIAITVLAKSVIALVRQRKSRMVTTKRNVKVIKLYVVSVVTAAQWCSGQA